MNELIHKSTALRPAGDARMTLILLGYPRAGDSQRAIDTLQMQLDGYVTQLGVETGAADDIRPPPLDEPSSEYIRGTLKRAVAYFEKYPRTPHVDPAFARSEQVITKTLAAAMATGAGHSVP